MTVSTSDYALLSQNAYQTPVKGQRVELGGVSYKALDYADTGTGFQATAYERLDTHEVIIAYRGTEFDREPLKDGGTDAGMVIAGVNARHLTPSPSPSAFSIRCMRWRRKPAPCR